MPWLLPQKRMFSPNDGVNLIEFYHLFSGFILNNTMLSRYFQIGKNDHHNQCFVRTQTDSKCDVAGNMSNMAALIAS